MNFFRSNWLYLLAAVVTIIGLVTGWYFFFLLVIPFGIFKMGKKDKD